MLSTLSIRLLFITRFVADLLVYLSALFAGAGDDITDLILDDLAIFGTDFVAGTFF